MPRVTDAEREQGLHYEEAETAAKDAGFEPKCTFDSNDPAAKQLGNLYLFV